MMEDELTQFRFSLKIDDESYQKSREHLLSCPHRIYQGHKPLTDWFYPLTGEKCEREVKEKITEKRGE